MSASTASPGHVTVVSLPGDLTSTNAVESKARLTAAAETLEQMTGPVREVRIELLRARMIDSVGLNLLVSVIKRVTAANGSVTLVVSATSVERILTFTRLNQIARVVRA